MKIKRNKALSLYIAAILMICAFGCFTLLNGCTSAESHNGSDELSQSVEAISQSAAALPTNDPSKSEAEQMETPAPQNEIDAEKLLITAQKAYDDALYVEWRTKVQSVKIPETADIVSMMGNYELFERICDGMEDAVNAAVDAAAAVVKDEFNAIPVCREINLFGWQEYASLFNAFGEETAGMVMSNIEYAAEYDEGIIRVSIELPPMREMLLDCDSDCAFQTVFVYAYLRTVYDDVGVEKLFDQYELPKGYINTLTDPLPGKYYIKDGWYDARQQNTRKHTGTDIKMFESTEIYSCTKGTIEFIGTNSIAGNYVAIMDPMGFEYHYYHMVALTDFLSVGDSVEAGQLIGYVGNTGNSDAPHLHLSIITPDFTYMNPYPVLLEMRQNRARFSV